ncbi:hypothetical protein VCR8J2_50015 [Vibrio coralliirubri]|nr:hypothetical protein VCR8J2_50015 [Vibrio coralliirubri]
MMLNHISDHQFPVDLLKDMTILTAINEVHIEEVTGLTFDSYH